MVCPAAQPCARPSTKPRTLLTSCAEWKNSSNPGCAAGESSPKPRSHAGPSGSRRLTGDFELPLLVPLQVSPRHLGVVSKQSEPVLRNRLGVEPLAALDGFERKQIKGHDPGQIQVGCRRNQIGDITSGLTGALDQDGLH